MASFKNSSLLTLENEGGYSNHPNEDYGGETYMGISRRWGASWAGWEALDALKQHGPIPQGAVGLVDLAIVQKFYMETFWKPLRCEEISSQQLANQFFDHAVTAGAGDAVKLLQLACGATVDGKMGPKTIEKTNAAVAADKRAINRRFFKLRTCFYLEASDKSIVQEANLPSWISRTVKCYTG